MTTPKLISITNNGAAWGEFLALDAEGNVWYGVAPRLRPKRGESITWRPLPSVFEPSAQGGTEDR